MKEMLDTLPGRQYGLVYNVARMVRAGCLRSAIRTRSKTCQCPHYKGVIMRRTRRALAAIAVPATALALVLAGCSGQTSTAGGSSAAGSAGGSATDTFTLGMTADINGWDPSAQPPYQAWGI